MAKKAVESANPRGDLVEILGEFTRFKNIDRAALMGVLEDVFRTMIRKKYGTDENFNIIVNVDKGDLQAFRERVITEDMLVTDENRQIPLSEALALDPEAEVGEDFAEVVSFKEFGRRHVLAAKQLLAQKIRDLEKSLIVNYYKELVGEIIVGEVYQIWKNEMLIMHEGNELIMPKSEQIPRDRYKKGDTIRAVVMEVEMRNGSPRIVVSRAAGQFLLKLFEAEVPEIYEGTILVRGVVREPGERAKMAVETYDERIDPVGACIGMRGSRIHGIVRELRNENIDVIHYSSDPEIYIQRALSPAKITKIEVDEENRQANVFLRADQVSLAIGKSGQNVGLAGKLTGYEIDIFRDEDMTEEDVELDEFKDEIDEWIIEEFKKIGCDTAKSVLALSAEDLERRTDLEREMIDHVLEILRREFEDD
jgi:N utilization substance protein A